MSLDDQSERYLKDLKRKAEEERENQVKEFGETHALVIIEGKTKIVYFEFDSVVNSLILKFSDRQSMADYYANRMINTNEGGTKGIKPIFPYWLRSKIRKTYNGVCFQPTKGTLANNKLPLPINGALNLYMGLTIEPKVGKCELIIGHIKEVWCSDNKSLFNYVVCWLARMMQEPGKAAETTLVLKSGQGTGKNIIVDILTSAFGNHAFTATKPQDILGQFNEHIATSVLIFMNEALWGGDKSSEGALKGLITDDFIFCERKYMPKFQVNNCGHLIIATNNDWYAPIDMDDRRFVVLDVSESKKGNSGYFTKLKYEIDNGGSAAFIKYLLDYDISGFKHRTLPTVQGKSKLDNQLATGGSALKWWFECLSEGCVARTEHLDTKGGNQILNDALGWDEREVK